MRVELNYGRGLLPVDIPDDCDVTVIRKPAMPVLEDPKGAVAAALARPVGAPPLAELARGRKNACILICDITRPVPNGTVLPVLVRTLLDAGLRPADIRVVVATGLHRPNEGDELRELVGDDWVLNTVRVENHFARNDADHVDLGVTPAGTRVRIDRRFVEADLKIVTGLVEPHFMAGWSGGRKVVTPGVAHAETITSLHTARLFEHPKSDSMVLDGNPLHAEQIAVVRLIGDVLAVNTVLDDERHLSFVNFGAVEDSHFGAIDFARGFFEVPVGERFKTVLSSSAGYPLDKTYYQTVKGMYAPINIMEPGADLIVVSEISEGFGSAEYKDAQRRLIDLGNDAFIASLMPKSHALIDEWQTEYQVKVARAGTIHLYTRALDAADRAITGVNFIDSPEAALAASLARTGDRRVAVVPEGPYVVPVYRP